jgi:hypothetical protein
MSYMAIGFFLSAIKQIVDGDRRLSDTRLRKAIDARIGQSERADDARKRLRRLLLNRQTGNRNRGGC